MLEQLKPVNKAFTLCWQIVCVLGSTFKDQAVFKPASFVSCWVFSGLPVCACRIPVSWGYVRAWSLPGLHFPFRVPSPSQLASIWGAWFLMGLPCTYVLPPSQYYMEHVSPLRIHEFTKSLCDSLLSFQGFPVKFLGIPQVCGFPQMVQLRLQELQEFVFPSGCVAFLLSAPNQSRLPAAGFHSQPPLAETTMLVELGRGIETATGKMPDFHSSSREVQLFFVDKFFSLCFLPLVHF